MEQIQLVPDFKNNEIQCPKCGSVNYKKAGKRKGKQRYKCKDCDRQFTEVNYSLNLAIHSKNIVPKNISPQEMRELDVWDLRVLGKKPDITKGGYSVNFIDISPNWLKKAIKDYTWSRVSNRSTESLVHYVSQLKIISTFITERNLYVKPNDIDRAFIIDLINYLTSQEISNRTIGRYISTFKDFLYFHQNSNLISISPERLIFPEDYPKRTKSEVKDIPEYVLNQLKNKLNILAVSISLMIEILLETGMRVSEVCNLKFNCISSDSDGDWWINCSRTKVYKESRLFISKELAIKIAQQQQFIRKHLSEKFTHLFCNTEGSGWFDHFGRKAIDCNRRELNHFVPVEKFIRQDILKGYLYQLAHEHNIIDASGEIYPIWRCHQFRHTHLTDLARKGTGIAHIMQRAGHASPQMAMQYIHLTDDDQKKKMKEVWDNAHFNMEGDIVAPVNPDLDTAEMQWIKKGMGMQTTDNGYCTLLWTQTCPHQDLPCKGCGSWVTTLDFLDSHKQKLEETEKIIENARVKGYQRQIEKNVPRADRLKKIISGMEKHKTMRGLGHNEWEEKE